MAKKSSKKTAKPVRPQLGEGVEILNAGSVLGVAAYLTLFESAARRALPAAVLLLPLCGMVCTAPGARTLVHRILSRIFKSKRSIYG